jgi:hypothetical protein
MCNLSSTCPTKIVSVGPQNFGKLLPKGKRGFFAIFVRNWLDERTLRYTSA